MKNKKIIIFIFLVYLIFALFSIRFFLFDKGTIGHNWDWVVPAIPECFDYAMNIVKYNWADRVLGEPIMPLSFSAKIWFLGLALTGNIFFGFKISQIMIISTILVSGITMFFLLKEIFHKDELFTNIACFFGGFFYAFSPFLYADFIGGSGGSFQTYAIFPLVFLFFIKANKTKKFIYIFLTAIILSIIALNFHNLLFSFLLIIFYPLLFENKKIAYKKLLIIFLIFFSINLYWIMPLGLSQMESKQYTSGEGVLTLDNIKYNVPDLTQILIGNGYIRNFYDFSMNDSIKSIWYIFSFLFIGFVFFFSIRKGNEKIKKQSFFWLAVFALSIILATGAKAPLGDYVIWAFRNISFFKFFRSPQFLIILPTLSIAVLTGIGMKNIFSSIKKEKTKYLMGLILFLIMLLWLHPSFISGNLGMEKLYKINIYDHVDQFRLPKEYEKVYEFLNIQKDDFKVLWLPMQVSPYYLNNSYQKKGQGLDPHILYTPHSSIFVDHAYYEPSKSFVWYVEDKICKNEILGKEEILFDIMNAKYIILRKDIEPIYSSCRGTWNKEGVEFMLDELSLNKLIDGKYIVIYKNEDYLNHIYTVNKFFFINNTKESVEEIKQDYFNPAEMALLSKEIDFIEKDKDTIDTFTNYSVIEFNLADFENDEFWTNGFNDSEHYTKGKKGFKAIAKYPGMTRIQRYVDFNLSFFNHSIDEISIDIYIENIENMHPNGFVIFFDSDGNDKNIFIHDPKKEEFKTGWNHFVVRKNNFDAFGAPSWDNIQKIGMDVYADINKTFNITFDNWKIYRKSFFKIDKYKNLKSKGFKIYNYYLEKESIIHNTGNKKPEIKFKKITPVKYKVKILEDNFDPFLLIFLESYHPDWRLYKGDVNWFTSFFKKSEDMHFNANIYANAWYIEDFNENYTIYYKKQNIFILFLLISLFFFFIFLWRSVKWEKRN